MNRVIQVGNGKIARIHRNNLPKSTRVVALVVRNMQKNKGRIKNDPTISKNTPIYTSIDEVYKNIKKPFFWDIVSDDHTHYELLRKILSVDQKSRVIIGKSPVSKKKAEELCSIFQKYPQAQITLTENYVTSNVLKKVVKLAKKYSCEGDVIIDFTKHRGKDFHNKRFKHLDTMIFGYEGPHMITVLHMLGKYLNEIKSVNLKDLHLPNKEILKEQGLGNIVFKNKDNTRTYFYISMNGKIQYHDPVLPKQKDVQYGGWKRYRIVVIKHKSKPIRIIGQFEPIYGIKRLLGKVFVVEDNKVTHEEIVEENTIKYTLNQQICFIKKKCEDYFPAELVKKFNILEKAYKTWRRKSKQK